MHKTGGAWIGTGAVTDGRPWYLKFRALGCWLWMMAASVLLGLFASVAWWWATTALCLAALAVLARDPQD